MPFIGNQPALSYTSFAVQHFTTSATTSYTLDHSVANENEIRLVINNVVQQPGSSYAYTASGTTLTLSAATASTDTMYAVFLGKAVQTVNPPNNSVNESQLSYPLTNFSSTGIDDNASANALTIDSSSNLQFNSGFGSVATVYGVRAWVNFNGTGTVAIQDSGNVSSVADNGTGVYTINFSSNFPDVNYCHLSGGSQMVGVGNNGLPVLDLNSASNKSVSSFKMIFTVTNSARDNEDINMAFLR